MNYILFKFGSSNNRNKMSTTYFTHKYFISLTNSRFSFIKTCNVFYDFQLLYYNMYNMYNENYLTLTFQMTLDQSKKHTDKNSF